MGRAKSAIDPSDVIREIFLPCHLCSMGRATMNDGSSFWSRRNRSPAGLNATSRLTATVLAFTTAGAVSEPALADPSFDCAKAATTAENLICGDSALAALDQSLSDAFQALRQQHTGAARDRLVSDQRAWLADRDHRCDIPAGSAEPTLAQRWSWAPCLAEQYRARLEQLGVVVPPVERPAGTTAAGFIHPLCLDLATGGRAETGSDRPIPILLDACNRGFRHVDVSRNDDGSFGASGAFIGSWFGYRPIGKLASGKSVILVNWSGGGTGQFSEIVAVRSATGNGETTISARTIVLGGDRCNGGIENASMRDENIVEVAVRATSADLVMAGNSSADAALDDLDSCAICCAGTLTYGVDVASNRETLASATINEIAPASEDPSEGAQACFDGLLRGEGSLPKTLTPSDLKQLAQRFRQTCVAGERQQGNDR